MNLRSSLGMTAFETGNLVHCRICEEWKDSSLFHRDRSTPTGFENRCASCSLRIRNRVTWEPRVAVCIVADCELDAALTYFCRNHRHLASRPAQKGYRRHVWRMHLVGEANG